MSANDGARRNLLGHAAMQVGAAEQLDGEDVTARAVDTIANILHAACPNGSASATAAAIESEDLLEAALHHYRHEMLAERLRKRRNGFGYEPRKEGIHAGR